MSKLTDSQAVVIAAIIGVIGIIVGAVLNPLIPKLIDSTGSTVSQVSLASEQISQRVFAYAGNDNPDGGWSAFSFAYDDGQTPIYRLDYSLPDDKNGYAGIAFQFTEGQNLTAYNAVQFKLIFSNSNDEIDFFIKDISNNGGRVHIVATGATELIFRYEFANFGGVNFNAIKEFGFDATTSFITDNHTVQIKDIRFVK